MYGLQRTRFISEFLVSHCKGKFHRIKRHRTQRVSRDIAVLILNHGTRRVCVVNVMPQPFTLGKQNQYLL